MRVFDSKSNQPFVKKTRRRFDDNGDARELTFSCYRGYQFLNRDRPRRWFLESLESARKEFSFELWGNVIMPEHVHVLIYSREPAFKAGKIAGRIKEVVARQAISHIKAHSPHWLPRITVREGTRTRRRF